MISGWALTLTYPFFLMILLHTASPLHMAFGWTTSNPGFIASQTPFAKASNCILISFGELEKGHSEMIVSTSPWPDHTGVAFLPRQLLHRSASSKSSRHR